MNLYDIKNAIDKMPQVELAILRDYINAKHASDEASNKVVSASAAFLKHTEASTDYEGKAYSLVCAYIDKYVVLARAKAHNSTRIDNFPEGITDKLLFDYTYNIFLTNSNVIALIKEYRNMTGSSLADSKHHIEKAIKTHITEILKEAGCND